MSNSAPGLLLPLVSQFAYTHFSRRLFLAVTREREIVIEIGSA